jgi:hypothetical protein
LRQAALQSPRPSLPDYGQAERENNHQEALYAEYRRLDKQGFFFKGKAKEAFAAAEAYDWKHLNALRDYDDAEKYLRGVLRERYDPKKLPVAMWTEQRAAKIVEQDALNREYHALEIETKNVEQIKRSVADILRADSPEPARVPQRLRGIEL